MTICCLSRVVLFQTMRLLVFGIPQLMFEAYLVYVIATHPDSLNGPLNAFVRVLVRANSWTIHAVFYPIVFLSGRPSRRRAFFSWMRKAIPFLQAEREASFTSH